eukprot:gene3042-4778_t
MPDEYLLFIDEAVSDENLEWIFPATSKNPFIAGASQNGGFGAVKAIHTRRKRVVVVHVDVSGVEALKSIYPGLIVDVQPNAVVYGAEDPLLTCPTTESGDDLPYHLRSMYQQPDDMGNAFAFDPTWGDGILAYITDTGADCAHSELAGRCTWLYNAVQTEPAEDTHGHGTAVASVLVGKTLGVSRASRVMVTKCLDLYNRGSIADCTEAMVAVADHERYSKTSTATSVINLSLVVTGGAAADLFRSAVEDLVDLGVIVVAAVGNEASTACSYLPASVEGVIGVGGLGVKASGGSAGVYVDPVTNHGSCVDIFAPGLGVKVAGVDHPDRFVFMSGSSFASPVVASMVVAFVSTQFGQHATAAGALDWL